MSVVTKKAHFMLPCHAHITIPAIHQYGHLCLYSHASYSPCHSHLACHVCTGLSWLFFRGMGGHCSCKQYTLSRLYNIRSHW